jgi:hypothetical protein
MLILKLSIAKRSSHKQTDLVNIMGSGHTAFIAFFLHLIRSKQI